MILILKLSELQWKVTKQDTVLPNTADLQQLIPFLSLFLPFCFHSITGKYFTYHPQLYRTRAPWINDILLIIKLLVSSFRLTYIYIISHCDMNKYWQLRCFTSQLKVVSPSWCLSIHSLSSNLVGDNVSCFRSFLYLSPYILSPPSPFLLFNNL